jgi:hypothetical protein
MSPTSAATVPAESRSSHCLTTGLSKTSTPCDCNLSNAGPQRAPQQSHGRPPSRYAARQTALLLICTPPSQRELLRWTARDQPALCMHAAMPSTRTSLPTCPARRAASTATAATISSRRRRPNVRVALLGLLGLSDVVASSLSPCLCVCVARRGRMTPVETLMRLYMMCRGATRALSL